MSFNVAFMMHWLNVHQRIMLFPVHCYMPMYFNVMKHCWAFLSEFSLNNISIFYIYLLCYGSNVTRIMNLVSLKYNNVLVIYYQRKWLSDSKERLFCWFDWFLQRPMERFDMLWVEIHPPKSVPFSLTSYFCLTLYTCWL